MGKVLKFMLGVILIPVVMTIVLAAYEEKTNEWVYGWLGVETEETKEETELETLKRLVVDNTIIHYNCGPLGAKLSGVMKKCPNPGYSTKNIEDQHITQTLAYTKGDHYLLFVRLTNDYVSSISVKDTQAFSSFTLKEIKRVFGEPSQKPFEHEFNGIKTTQYTYKLSDARELAFTYNHNEKRFEQISLESTDSLQRFKAEQSVDYMIEEEEVASGKEGKVGGVSDVIRIKEWAEQGDMIRYECGRLGTKFADVQAACGEKVKSKGFNHQEKTQYLKYAYPNREARLEFFKGELTSISIDMYQGEPLAITPEEVKQVFGEPLPREETGLETESTIMKYRIEDKDLSFTIDPEKGCTYMWLRKADMYDDAFGFLLPEVRKAVENE